MLASNPAVEITLIDKNNYEPVQPLAYQVATGLLAPSNAAFSLHNILQHDSNADVKMAEVVSADLNTRTIRTPDGKMYQGDFLVLAAGSQVNFPRGQMSTSFRCTHFKTQSRCALASLGASRVHGSRSLAHRPRRPTHVRLMKWRGARPPRQETFLRCSGRP
jgi:NADH dehydrogenase FAD-containing subunit